jgi:hypothetical protein
MSMSEPSLVQPTPRAGARRWLRAVLFVAGLGLAGWLVWSAGLSRVAEALRDGGHVLPLVVLLEVGIVVTDLLALRALLGGGSRAIGRRTWLRSAALAYAAAVALPAGRAAGEAVRTGALSSAVGLGRAAVACSRLQACALLGNAVASTACASSLVGVPGGRDLSLALFGNGLLCAVIGGALVVTLHNERFARWVKARLPRFAPRHGDDGVPAPALRARTVRATLLCVAGRVVQCVQYGVLVRAMGGRGVVGSALAAQGIHLVGATVGDLVPNQMGATEGAYRVFADVLGLGDAPARALSIALVMRLAQVSLAAIGFALAMAMRQPPAEGAAEDVA